MIRVLFAGSPGIAVPSLRVLSRMEQAEEGVELAGVLTNPDSSRRRRGVLEPTEVSEAAAALSRERPGPSLVQLKPERLDAPARSAVAALKPDLLVCFAFGRIFGPRFLSLFPLGGINLHPSLLPRYRGAAPIPGAILDGERETGICIQRMAAEMDTGDLLGVEQIPLTGRETTASLTETAGERGAVLLGKLLGELCRTEDVQGALDRLARPQEGEASYTRVIRKEDGLIDWRKGAGEIDAQIRAYTPWPLSFTQSQGERLFILEAAPCRGAPYQGMPSQAVPSRAVSCQMEHTGGDPPGTVLGKDPAAGILVQTGEGVLGVTRLQYQARKALNWQSFLNGARGFLGSRLGRVE